MDYTKIEQVSSGAAYCQMMDAIKPGCVPLSKVKFDSIHSYDHVHNFKLLQKASAKNGIRRNIDIDKLTKGKYLDNLEFLQWFKRYFDGNYISGEYYPAKEKRSKFVVSSKARPRMSVMTHREQENLRDLSSRMNIDPRSVRASVAVSKMPELRTQTEGRG